MEKTLQMLIGDDAYKKRYDREARVTAENDFYWILTELKEAFGEDYTEGEFVDDHTYVCEDFPLPGYDRLEAEVVETASEMVSRVDGDYNLVVSDLSYGWEDRLGGVRVIEAFKDNPADKVIFTATDDEELLEKAKKCGVPVLSDLESEERTLKASLLGKYIAKNYGE